MIDDELIPVVRGLRARGLSPKEIARNLGVRPAAVANLVRAIAAERVAAEPDDDLAGCWVNGGWSTGLSIDGRPDWPDGDHDEAAAGLVTAVVARRRPNRRTARVCVYLVDVYCLGVKNVIGPDELDDQALRRFKEHVFAGYRLPETPAPIELVRDVVLGGVAFARQLGFMPHPDFEPARAHLGPWAGSSAITFGRNGKPMYVSGPFDDSEQVIRTLRRAVGRNGFHYTLSVGNDELGLTG